MPKQWPEEIFNSSTQLIAHADIESLDLEEGKWFKCKLCSNSRNKDNKFVCRPFAASEITGQRGHMETKSHTDKKAGVAVPAPVTVTTLLAQGAPSGEQACATAATATPAGAAATMPDASSTPKAPTPCEGFGWEKSEPTLPWQHWYGTYVFFVEGAPKASSKFTIERVGGTFKAKSTDCTGTGLKGWQ